jgi:hypothetical protein
MVSRRRMEEEVSSRDQTISELRASLAQAENDAASRRKAISELREKNRTLEASLLQLKSDMAIVNSQLEDARSGVEDDDAASRSSPSVAPTPAHSAMSPPRLETIQQYSFSSKSQATPTAGSNRKASGFGLASPAGTPHSRQQPWWRTGADWGRSQRTALVKAVEDNTVTWANAASALAQLLILTVTATSAV